MYNWKEQKKFFESIRNMSDDELKNALDKFNSIKNTQQENYRNLMREISDNNVDGILIALNEEMQDRKQNSGEEMLEGSRWHICVEILHERKNYSFGERNLEEWIMTLPGVKAVKIQGDGEDMYDTDLEDCFYDYFDKQ